MLLVYHLEPFEANTEITGYIKFVAWVSLDVPDTDFAVDVYEIMPSGMSILLTQDIVRQRLCCGRSAVKNDERLASRKA